MLRKDERWLNNSGLNLIRIVIGSYFAAVALDLVSGVDQSALFAGFAPPMIADLLGSTLLFVASLTFMTGIYLRMSALVLALFVFSSSLIQNFLLMEIEDISAFWRDITLVCAVILNYSNLNRQDMRRADLMRYRMLMKQREARLPMAEVKPRRVTPSVFSKPKAKRTPRPGVELPSFMKKPADRSTSGRWIDINGLAEA